ncbi:MAG TPA: peptide chain release factor N(5)-glutamine methyltransferase [Pyrinomonadaceae bacterium]|nr:peptide chain release factor N(5)-glutamine methyltransferase [Pyrinomonadaceae bacterium]
METITEKLKAAETVLRGSGIAEPRREAMSLLMLAIEKDKTFIYARPEYEPSSDEAAAFDSFLKRRSNREPLQYISGTQEFYGLDFEVTPDVLIPRPETEMIVEHAIEILRASGGGSLCDVGTGSGCIPISILHELTFVRGYGLDVSQVALAVARRNAEKHNVGPRLELVKSDIFGALQNQKFDLIVSNPPYIPADDISGLQAEVRDFEPLNALTDSADGLSIIRRIVNESPDFLSNRGHLLLEIGVNQSAKVAAMFDNARWQSATMFADLQGIPRVVSGRLK